MFYNTDEPCARCLVVLNASSFTRVRNIKDTSSTPIEFKGGAGRPRELRAWYQQMMEEVSNPVFEQDATYDVLIPVTVWHGDPICPWHLIEMRQAEWDYVYPPASRRR